MRTSIIVAQAILSSGLAAQTRPVELKGALPTESGIVDQVVFVEPGVRTLFVHRNGDLILYDQATRTRMRLAEQVWDATLSRRGDLIAYVKGGETAAEHYVWVLPVDPRTGQATGAERRLSLTIGDVPSISPDGRFVAFARDDTSGVGQSLLVVPIGGGKERVVAANMPSSIHAIAWTPDGKWIYFGVNMPVPCVPEWSCLPLGEDQWKWGSIRRVPSGGNGTASVVVPRARAVYPGLSPDGAAIVYTAVEGTRRCIVTSADGSERASFTLTPNQSIQGWTGATLLVGESQMGRGLASLSTLDISRRP